MSRRYKIKHMSSDELKSKLYAHFQKTGSLDHLRTQLRGQLVSELFKVAEPIDMDKFPNASDVDKCLLPIQVCNWLIYDHLLRQDYQYSLSTFVTEAQLPYPEKFLTAGDILRLLGLNHNTPEFDNISKLYTEKNELEYLHSLLLAILKTLFNIPKRDASLNQTHNQESKTDVPSEKKSNHNQEGLNQNFTANKAGVYDASFMGEFSKPKELTLDRSFLSNYDTKVSDMSFEEQLQSVKKESEREVQKLRHKLLEELENLHSQEHKMHLEVEFAKSELKREQNKLIKEKEMLKESEVLLEKEIRHEYEMKMRDAESDFAAKFHFKDKEIQSLKAKMAEKDQKLTRVETELSSEKDNYELMKRELEDLKHMYKIIQDKYSSVLDENTNLLKKFENMSDYTVLKEELFTKSNEVKRLQNEIKDIHLRSEAERKKYVETVRNLEENLNMKEPELIQTRKELSHVQDTLTAEKSIWNRERNRLEQELSEFKELYKTVIQRMEDQKGDIQDLHQTINVLNYKLTNNIINLTKSESLRPFKSIHTAAETSLKRKPENLFTKRNVFLAQESTEKYNESSLKFLSDAKNRFGKLKQEENAVQEKYSYIFSTIPDFNKQSHLYLENFNVSVPHSNVENYSFAPLSRSVNFSSASSFNNWSRSKMTSDIRSSYSLNDVKRMVSNSLFPGNQIDSLINTENLDISSKVPNVTSSSFKDIRKPETFPLFSTNTHYSFPSPDDNVSVSNAAVSKSLGSALPSKHSSQFSPHVAKDDHSKQASYQLSQQSGDSLTLESEGKELSQNYGTISNPKQNEPEMRTVGSSDFQSIGVSVNSAQHDLPGNLSSSPCHSNKNIPPSLSESETVSISQGFHDQSKDVASGEGSKSISLQPTQEIPDVMSDNPQNSSELSSSLFVNLDAAWKQRSSFPSSSTYMKSFIKEANTEQKSNNSFPSVPAVNKEKHISDSRVLHSLEKDKNNQQMGQYAISSAETVDEGTVKTCSETALNNQTEDSKATDVDDPVVKESEFNLEKNTANSSDDKTNEIAPEMSINIEEKEGEKSAEKIASADSLSELSEVHLSCGSEEEQQKEDSDAW